MMFEYTVRDENSGVTDRLIVTWQTSVPLLPND